MHATVQQSGLSPKQVGSSLVTTQLKSSSSDGMQNCNTLVAQGKGKKRERVDQGFDSAKRDRASQKDDIDFCNSRYGSVLKSEIMKIADKGGFVDIDGVEKMIQLMQREGGDRKIDLESRSLLAGVIAVTDNLDCLSRFVQLRGLPVLDEWMQEAHKSKTDDGTRIIDGDKSVEDFLLILLRALDKLPVNLNALQTCNVGKSVNHLRTCKNVEIQKKARNLVDTWKKRVEAEMNSSDGRNSSIHPWSARPRNSTVASEVALRNTVIQPRSSSVKPLQVDIVKPASVGLRQLSASASLDTCSSDQPKTISSGSSSESLYGNKVLDGSSRQRRSVNGFSDVLRQKASNMSFLLKNPPERLLQPNVTYETSIDPPVSEGCFQKIVEQDRSPERSASEGSLEDPSITNGSSSHEQDGQVLKVGCDAFQENFNTEALQHSDLKSEASMSDKDSGPYTSMLDIGHSRGAEVATTATSVPEDEIRSVKSPESSCRPTSALLERCFKHTESCSHPSAGNSVLANAVSGEMSKPETFSVSGDDQTSIIAEKKPEEIGSSGAEPCEHKVMDCEERLRYNDGRRFFSEDDNGNAITDGNSGNEKALDKINATEAGVHCGDGNDVNDNIEKGVSSVYSGSVAKSEELLHSDNKKIPGPEDTEGDVDERIGEAYGVSLSPQSEKQERGQVMTFADDGVEKASESKVTEQSRDGEVDELEVVPSSSDMDTAIKFDLNEGLVDDDGKCVESMNLPPPSFSAPFQLPVSTQTFGFPSCVTVAAAAKGCFIPPDGLLASKGELGWKGSAATSAFRRAEPRKLAEVPIPNTKKKNHSPLAIDLNVPHECILEELSSTSCNPDRTCRGLDLDLNSTYFGSTSSAFAPGVPPAKPSAACKSNIDLNNGPGVDEASVEPILLNQHARCISLRSPVSRHTEIGNYCSWLPAGNTCSTGMHPSLYPEHSFPLVAAEDRALSNQCNAASGLFQYPVFPFGTSFPLPSATSSVVSTDYVDSGKLFFPGVRGHVGPPTGLVSSQLLKPYSEQYGGEGNRIWVRPRLDLNAGPGVHEMDGRDEMSPFTSHVFLEEHTRMYQPSGSGLKRNDCKPSLWP